MQIACGRRRRLRSAMENPKFPVLLLHYALVDALTIIDVGQISRGRTRTVGRMEQDTEFESAISPWRGDVLPLHQSCIKELSIFFLSDAASFTPKYCRYFNVAIIYSIPLVRLTSGAQLVQAGNCIHPRKFCGWG